MKSKFDKSLWNYRWKNELTGWDIGYASPAIVAYFEKVKDKSARILIPGCGNAYEAQALFEMGFTDITVLDISDIAIQKLNDKFEHHDEIKVSCQDFFLHQGQYDYIIEQTFFCALNTELRSSFADKILELLKPGGVLIGLLFNRLFDKAGPPFGGSKKEYENLFSSKFIIKNLDLAENSVPGRDGFELFIEFKKH